MKVWKGLSILAIVASAFISSLTMITAFSNPTNLSMAIEILCLCGIVLLTGIAIQEYQKEKRS